jgi:oxalate decarboxylase
MPLKKYLPPMNTDERRCCDSSMPQGFSRRDLLPLGAAAAFLSPQPAHAQPPSDAIPSLKYDIEAQSHWKGEAGSANEATVAEFPVSQSIAGVSMRLKPGAIRELHWHALAAEWAYMIEGRCRTTVIMPNGQSAIDEFGPGDTWYFPKGHGHALQGLGPGEAHFLLGFDSGHFSEFGTFSITDWIATTPPEIASRVLNVPASTLAKFPRKEVYIGPGPVPNPVLEEFRLKDSQTSQFAHKYRLDQQPPRVFEGGIEYMVQQRDFAIQSTFTAVKMILQPGALREMHWHPHADEWQYYLSGQARMTVFGSHGRTRVEDYRKGNVGFVPQGYGHYIEQVGSQQAELLILFNSPEYQEISLANWLGGNPSSLLAANFGVSQDVIDQLPMKERGILRKR